jgi:hypothetical protein
MQWYICNPWKYLAYILWNMLLAPYTGTEIAAGSKSLLLLMNAAVSCSLLPPEPFSTLLLCFSPWEWSCYEPRFSPGTRIHWAVGRDAGVRPAGWCQSESCIHASRMWVAFGNAGHSSSPLWPVLTSPKHFPPMKIITWMSLPLHMWSEWCSGSKGA